MTFVNDALMPRDESEREIFAIEELIFEVQYAIQSTMREKGVSKKDLARKLSLEPSHVSEFFSDEGANLTLEIIGRISHALGERYEFVPASQSSRAIKDDYQEFRYSWSLYNSGYESVANDPKPKAPIALAA